MVWAVLWGLVFDSEAGEEFGGVFGAAAFGVGVVGGDGVGRALGGEVEDIHAGKLDLAGFGGANGGGGPASALGFAVGDGGVDG